MDEKQKLLKLRAEVGNAMQNLENALNHLRDYQEILDNMTIEMLEKTLERKRKELEERE